MDIKCYTKDHSLVVVIEGEIDHHSVKPVREKLEREFMRTGARHIIFDFNKVGFMDSSGIGMVLGRYRALEKQAGIVAVAGMSSEAARIFELSGLHKLIRVYDDVEAAAKDMTL